MVPGLFEITIWIVSLTLLGVMWIWAQRSELRSLEAARKIDRQSAEWAKAQREALAAYDVETCEDGVGLGEWCEIA